MKTACLYSKIDYPLVCFFTKNFTKGPMKGTTFRDSLHFVSQQSADRWIAGVKKYAKRNGWYPTEIEIKDNKNE